MDPKKLFQKYYKRIFAESIVKSIICGLAAGLAALFIAALVCWFVGYKGFWVLIVSFVAASAAVGLLTYFLKFRPTTRTIAQRVDELGLEERLITMTELEGDPSYIAMRQREDAMKSLSSVSADLIKIAVSVPLIVAVAVAAFCGIGGTTVYAMYSAGAMKSGVEMITNASEDEPELYKVEYLVEGKGAILGEAKQEVYENEDALAVMAMPQAGYIFVGWSDGNKDAYRVDFMVTGDIKVTAVFAEALDVDPDDDKDNNPEPDDLPPTDPNDDEDGEEIPTDKPSDDAGGKWNNSDYYLDGETDYGGDLGDATDNAQNSGNGDDSGLIGDYLTGIQK